MTMHAQPPILCLELYSGIGGMHLALKRTGIHHVVVAAIDINNIANDVYRHNFTETPCFNRIIESLTVKELTTLRKADLWTMSPPCQPFTRQGKQGFSQDERSQSFFHVMKLIQEVRPKFIFLENVKGFDNSDVLETLLNCLKECNYKVEQYLLSPLQFGIPNCRLRFYLFAELAITPEASNCNRRAIHIVPPTDVVPLPNCACPVCMRLCSHITAPQPNFPEYAPFCSPLSNYLITLDGDTLQSLLLSEKQLYKGFRSMDIVTSSGCKSNCFTKGYGKKLDGAGSVLQTAADELAKEELDKLKASSDPDDQATLTYARSLQLRHFHPREIANLMQFPAEFEFPPNVQWKQQYRLLGNSVNILVIAHILHWHLPPSIPSH